MAKGRVQKKASAASNKGAADRMAAKPIVLDNKAVEEATNATAVPTNIFAEDAAPEKWRVATTLIHRKISRSTVAADFAADLTPREPMPYACTNLNVVDQPFVLDGTDTGSVPIADDSLQLVHTSNNVAATESLSSAKESPLARAAKKRLWGPLSDLPDEIKALLAGKKRQQAIAEISVIRAATAEVHWNSMWLKHKKRYDSGQTFAKGQSESGQLGRLHLLGDCQPVDILNSSSSEIVSNPVEIKGLVSDRFGMVQPEPDVFIMDHHVKHGSNTVDGNIHNDSVGDRGDRRKIVNPVWVLLGIAQPAHEADISEDDGRPP